MFKPRKPFNPRLSYGKAQAWVNVAKAQKLATRKKAAQNIAAQARAKDTGRLGFNPKQVEVQITDRLLKKGVPAAKVEAKVPQQVNKLRRAAAMKAGKQIAQQRKSAFKTQQTAKKQAIKQQQTKAKAQLKARQAAVQSLAKRSKQSAQFQARAQKQALKTQQKAQQQKLKAQQAAKKAGIKNLMRVSKASAQKQAKFQKAQVKAQQAQVRQKQQQAKAAQAEKIKRTGRRLLAARIGLNTFKRLVQVPISKMAGYGRWR